MPSRTSPPSDAIAQIRKLSKVLILDNALLLRISSIAGYIDFAFLVLLALDVIFLLVAELIVQMMRR